jgi:putative Holliday junction resolvase
MSARSIGRVLGVDLGARRIGLALCDPARVIASPLRVIERGRTVHDDHVAIVATARENDAVLIVVGLPLSLRGGAGPAARAARAEVVELQATAGSIPVVMHDERLTTVTAQRALADAKVTPSRRRGIVDKVAAAVMLQAYLDREAST